MRVQSPSIPEGVRTLRLIILALVSGVAMFAGVAAFVGPIDASGPSDVSRMLLYVSATMLAVAFLAAVVVAGPMRTMLGKELEQGSAGGAEERFPRALFAKALVRAALFEAAALLACVAYLMGHDPLCLLVVGAGVIGIFAQMPSEDRVREQIEETQRERL